MHELAVTESILSIAKKHAEIANARKVTDINIVIGKFSSIVDDSVQFYWEIISKDTVCEGSVLHFQRIPARFKCLDCSQEYELSGDMSPCPHCGSIRVKIISGEEFWLDSIEIER